ncbi:potassium transporter family protein [Asticcacaulis biprosthecium C19]|uniref:Probable potassium transport system protein Kup n=1 Tax=Asticcacaulis biprosthecium C19 TaxID=715226 RepID=F4QK18_9CAUL|nr:potassium transporter Kup [Asticcacaulis biprosthecium]EGF92045.1 potassium transporter family protein [Asticcacaulis biprosthecium C19]
MTGDTPAEPSASSPTSAQPASTADTNGAASATLHTTTSETEAVTSHGHGKEGFLALAVGSIGVVFGDIGTSPLYAMREALHHARGDVNPEHAVLGVVSLVLWTMTLFVTIKYVTFFMRADNKGEGGTLALMALAQKALGRYSPLVYFLGICGAALFYGDGIITPAISVLSAVEGLKDAPGLAGRLDPYLLPIAAGILIALFMVQAKGTGKVAKFFGPITVVWFLVLGGLGAIHLADDLRIFYAINPWYGFRFLMEEQLAGFIILGSVFLCVTGAEALYADMGHFGKKPIQMSWIILVFPCLALNYLGQGAMILDDNTTGENPFWNMVPEMAYWPILILATIATVIASQAVITGAFSLTQQAVQLGLLPRIEIRRTSETQAGQIYVPSVNTFLLIGVLILLMGASLIAQARLAEDSAALGSSVLASAYGIAVTGAMFVDTLLAWFVCRYIWKWNLGQTCLLLVPLALVDMVFITSNLLKVPDGAWLPLVFGAILVLIMLTWAAGTRTLTEKARRDSVALMDLVEMLKKRPPHRVAGTAIFLTSDADIAPVALMHNLKHNKVLHEKNIILTVRTTQSPRVAEGDRITIEVINEDFKKVTLSYGFMESPNLPKALGLCRKLGLKFDIMATSFFLGKRNVVPSANSGMPLWQDKLFIFLMKNAANPTEFFHIPPGRVVELGTQVTV